MVFSIRRMFLELVAYSFVFFTVLACDETCPSYVKYSTGPFDIVYNPQGDSLIKVYNGTSLVWFTASLKNYRNFASAVKVTESVEQNGGVYVITNTILDTCDEMSITNHGSAGGDIVYFNGTICNDTTFSLAFQAHTVTDEHQSWSHLQLNFSIPHNSSYNQLWLSYGCAEDEHFYGFGAQYSKFDMKGHRLPLFLSEQGVGRGLEPLTVIVDAFSKGAGIGVNYSNNNDDILFRWHLVYYLHSCSILHDKLSQSISAGIPSVFCV